MRAAMAMAVHAYTATGPLWGFLACVDIFAGDYVRAFVWLAVAVVVDATDGVLARAVDVKQHAPSIDGRKLDDIADYLNYTFVPILLIWHGGWLPEPHWLFGGAPLMASLFAFANTGAKEDDDGFFLGFPSYWNIVAFYIAVWLHHHGPVVVGGLLLFLALLSVLPVRFLYPTRTPRFRKTLCLGGAVWLGVLVAMLPHFPDPPDWLTYASLIYPALYVALSFVAARGRS